MSAPCPVFGFIVTAVLHEVPEEHIQAMTDDLIDTLEASGLMMNGGGDRVREYVVSRDGSQATDADCRMVAAWAGRWAHAATITVSDLVDLTEAS